MATQAHGEAGSDVAPRIPGTQKFGANCRWLLDGEGNGDKVGRGPEIRQAFLIAVENGSDLEHPRSAVIPPVSASCLQVVGDWAECRLHPKAKAFKHGVVAIHRFADGGH